MSRSFYFSKRAEKRLIELLEYLEKNWSEKEKNNFIAKLDRSVKIISKFPESFPHSKSNKFTHKCVLTKHNILIYRIHENEIEIIMIFDSRQNPKKILKK